MPRIPPSGSLQLPAWAAALPWLLLAGFVGGGIWMATDMRGRLKDQEETNLRLRQEVGTLQVKLTESKALAEDALKKASGANSARKSRRRVVVAIPDTSPATARPSHSSREMKDSAPESEDQTPEESAPSRRRVVLPTPEE